MGDLSAFLATNAKKMPLKEVIISDRFTDSEGAPVPWQIKPISAKEDIAIKKRCTYKEQIKGKRGQYEEKLDSDKYVYLLTASCVVFPTLKDAELQQSYGVEGEVELLSTMLSSGEMVRLLNAVQEINGLDEDFEDKVEEVKNV